jgi:hypothetical protein
VVGEADGIDSELAGGTGKKPMAVFSSGHLKALASPLPTVRDRQSLGHQFKSKTFTECPDKRFVLVRFTPPQPVVCVGDVMRRPEPAGLPREGVQKGDGIRPAGDGNQQTPTGRNAAAVRQCTSKNSGQGIQRIRKLEAPGCRHEPKILPVPRESVAMNKCTQK